mmetsp:Transcript_27591/g.91605  ORF Transcript_27591/g.91605 Transcript_27591/m.91605 type:complete len:235 (-) Transcript_27591:221-925(-)
MEPEPDAAALRSSLWRCPGGPECAESEVAAGGYHPKNDEAQCDKGGHRVSHHRGGGHVPGHHHVALHGEPAVCWRALCRPEDGAGLRRRAGLGVHRPAPGAAAPGGPVLAADAGTWGSADAGAGLQAASDHGGGGTGGRQGRVRRRRHSAAAGEGWQFRRRQPAAAGQGWQLRRPHPADRWEGRRRRGEGRIPARHARTGHGRANLGRGDQLDVHESSPRLGLPQGAQSGGAPV